MWLERGHTHTGLGTHLHKPLAGQNCGQQGERQQGMVADHGWLTPSAILDTQILEAQDVFDLVTLKREQLESGPFTTRFEKAPVLPCVPSA